MVRSAASLLPARITLIGRSQWLSGINSSLSNCKIASSQEGEWAGTRDGEKQNANIQRNFGSSGTMGAKQHAGRTICATGIVLLSLTFSFNAPAASAEVECIWAVEKQASKARPSGFRPQVGMCYEAYLHGTIEKGDYEKVVAFYRPSHKILGRFRLNSNGGDNEEAMKIGKLFRRNLISAIAPQRIPIPGVDLPMTLEGARPHDFLCGQTGSCECTGACALIWFGAVYREGSVGLRRPPASELKHLDPETAAAAYKIAVKNTVSYLDGMEAPRSAVDSLMRNSSADTEWITTNGNDGLDAPPSMVELTDAACGSITKHERTRWSQLASKAALNSLTADERLLKELLDKKVNDHAQCESNYRYDAVDLLPPP